MKQNKSIPEQGKTNPLTAEELKEIFGGVFLFEETIDPDKNTNTTYHCKCRYTNITGITNSNQAQDCSCVCV